MVVADTASDTGGAVTELGYLGFGVRSLSAWKAFAADVLGLEVVADDGSRGCALRMDYWQQRFFIEENGTDDLDFIGWRVPGRDALERIQFRLKRADIPFEVASRDRSDARGVLGLIALKDPAGVQTEIFYGPRIEAALPFRAGRRMHSGFLTGAKGLGHVVTNAMNSDACEEFYRRFLGMQGSVEFELSLSARESRLRMHFMSCNARQHSVAFAGFGGAKRLSHVMTEVRLLEDVGLTRDIVKRKAIPIQLDIGQHHNDRAVSFYFETPSGWHWECGWGTCEPSGQAEWGSAPIWGHEFNPSNSSRA